MITHSRQILEDYAKKMRDAENESHEGKRKAESLWPIMRISHARSKYIYELYYKREAISRELYDWLLKEGYADPKYVCWTFDGRLKHDPLFWQPHSKVEKDRIWKVVLSTLHTDEGLFTCPLVHMFLLIFRPRIWITKAQLVSVECQNPKLELELSLSVFIAVITTSFMFHHFAIENRLQVAADAVLTRSTSSNMSC